MLGDHADPVVLPRKPKHIASILKGTRDKIAYVAFKKRGNNKIRRMWFQAHLSSDNLAGGSRAYDPEKHDLLTVYDVRKNGVRSISLDNVVEFTVNGVHYRLEDADDVIENSDGWEAAAL